ncbi:MFS transporter [Paraburkholderia phenazinium]|nr:MFS transporter [Paraburkholderia phenazinium]
MSGGLGPRFLKNQFAEEQAQMQTSQVERSTVRIVRRRLLPLICTMFVAAFLDRVNVGFAAIQMNHDLSFGPEVFGLAAGIFFIPYTLFEVPSILVQARVGARLWLARIMVSWGVVASAMMFVQGPTSFYALRLLLGLAEAGFVPGVTFYIAQWFPERERARAIAIFALGIPIAVVIGAPVSGLLMGLDGTLALRGWQWLFVLEGVPSVIIGFAVFFLLPDRPRDAKWLTPEQSSWLEARLATEGAAKVHAGVGRALTDRRTLLLAVAYGCSIFAVYGVTFWLPQIVKAVGSTSDITTGFVTAIPYLVSGISTYAVSRHSDKTGERRLHIVLPFLVGAAGFAAAGAIHSPMGALAALSVGAAGVLSASAVFWTLPASMFAGAASAGVLGLINTIGNVGGFVGPVAVGAVKNHLSSFGPVMFLFAAAVVVSASIVGALTAAPTNHANRKAPPV